MIASGGKMLEMGNRFSYRHFSLTTSVVNVDSTRMKRARMGSFEPEVDGDESDVISVQFKIAACGLEQNELSSRDWAIGPT